MNTSKIILNAVLVFSLGSTGFAFADEATATKTQNRETVRTETANGQTVRAEHREETKNMTAEEREAYRAEKQAEMTKEQRQEMRATARANKDKGTKARDGSGSSRSAGAAQGTGAKGGR